MIIVAGEKYKVERDDLLKDGDEGECCCTRRVITIDKSLKGDKYISTLIHETIHAVFEEYSIRQVVDMSLEEIIAENIAKTIIKNFNVRKKPIR